MKKIGNIKYHVFLFVSCFFAALTVLAGVQLKVELNPREVGVGDQAQLTVVAVSDDDFQIDQEPVLTEGDGLKVIDSINSGRSSSSRMNIINGKTEFSKTVSHQFDYILQFTKKGRVHIPDIKVVVDGQAIVSAGFDITVAAKALNQESARSKKGTMPDPFMDDEDDVFSQLLKQRQQIMEEVQKQFGQGAGSLGGGLGGLGQSAPVDDIKISNLNPDESFFLVADVDKSQVYEGQQITVHWYIFTKGIIESLDRAKFPDLKGFWKEIIEEVPGLQFIPINVNGLPYKRALIASHALFPIKAGTATIDEFKIKAKVRNLTRMGLGQLHEFTKASKATSIKVLPLPQENRPQSFSGAVGQFQIQTVIDNTQVQVGQPFSLKVRFEGVGNAKLIDLPPINWPESLEVFDTKNESKFYKNGQSYKEFEILLTPQVEGSIKIPIIRFSYFDPDLKQYITKSTEELSVTATKSANGVEDKSSTIKTDILTNTDSKKDIKPEQLIIRQLDQSIDWMNFVRWGIVGLLVSLIAFYIIKVVKDLSTIQMGPRFDLIIKRKWEQINTQPKDALKDIAKESVTLMNYLIQPFLDKNETVENKSIADLIERLPLDLKTQHGQSIVQLMDYFQVIAFAPDSVRDVYLANSKFNDQLDRLKKISDDFVSIIRDSKS